MKVDLTAKGYGVVFKPYQAEAMKYLWSSDEGRSSRDVYLHVIGNMPTKEAQGGEKRPAISRASIINSLNDLVDEGVLDFHEVTGKGGHRRIYEPGMSPMELIQYLTAQAIKSLTSLAEALPGGAQ